MVRRSLLFTLTSQASGTWTYSTVRPEGRTSEAAKEAVAAKTARADVKNFMVKEGVSSWV